MENIEIKFDFLKREHLSSLVALYQSIFNKKVDEHYFESKYGLLLAGQMQMSVVGKIDGKVIGFFGAIPHTFELGNQKYSMLYTCDYFLEEAYRGKGVFDQFYKYIKEKAIAQNFDYFYTFDSAQTHQFGQKMGWIAAPSFVGMEWKLFPKTAKSILERTAGSEWSLKRLRRHLAPIEKELKLKHLPKTSLVYDPNFLKMKQFGNRFFIHLNGCNIWLKYDYRMTIGVIEITEEGDVFEMLNSLKNIAWKSGIHHIVIHIRPEDPLLEILKINAIPAKGQGITFESYFASYLPLKDDLPDFNEFTTHFSHGDMF